jgi:hypothetical protein
VADTADVLQTAIAALTGLVGGLASTAIAIRRQEAGEWRQQRERAAELFGPLGPLLTELHPDRIWMNLPLAPSEGRTQQSRRWMRWTSAPALSEQLSMLAAWWPTPEGSELAQRLEVALFNVVFQDRWLIGHVRRNADTTEVAREARNVHHQAELLVKQLRAELRGQVALALSAPRVGCAVLWHGPSRHARRQAKRRN